MSLMKFGQNDILSVEYTMLTPALAKMLLETNIGVNRAINNNSVDRIMESLKDGSIVFNGDTIKVNRTGEMFDGQHRCTAVVETGIAMPILIVRGLNDAAMAVTDQNLTRTVMQILHTTSRDVKHASIAVAMQRLILIGTKEFVAASDRRRLADYVWDNRKTLEKWASWSKSLLDRGEAFTISPSHSLSRGKRADHHRQAASPSTLGALGIVMVEILEADEQAVCDLWEGVVTGMTSDILTKNAAGALRNYLTMTIPLLMIGGGSQIAELLQNFDTIIRTYNRWVSGGQISKVMSRKTGLDAIRYISDLTPAIKAPRR